MFPSEQPNQNDNINIIINNNNNNNNTRSTSLDIKRKKIVNSLKRIIRRSIKKCCWPPSNHLVSAAKPTLPISSYLLALISCSSILLLLFIVHSAQSTCQPSLAMSWPSSPLFDQQTNTEKGRVKRSPPSSEAGKSPRPQESPGKLRFVEVRPTFRDGQSANNRGSLQSYTRLQTSGAPTTSQWIPIVKPQLHSNSSRTGQAPSPEPPPERLAGGSDQVPDNQARSNRLKHQQSNRQRLQPLESHNHHIRHMHMARQHPQHQGRRPRFNYEPPVVVVAASTSASASSPPAPGSGLYRRVLLCDKTLVSLEYIRNLNSEHRWRRRRRPMMATGHLHMPGPVISGEFELSDFTDDIDNSIDLEGNYHSSPIARQDQSPNMTATTTTNTSNSTDDINNSIDRMAHMSSSFNTYHHNHHHRHRLPGHMLLGDDDPLVRCDMWDLEKGLKNRAPPDFLVRQAVKADFETVREAINRCRQLSERTHVPSGSAPSGLDNTDESNRDHSLEIMSTEDLLSLFSMKRGLMPGTKWCGLGDQAATYNDLGPKYRIDICCRAHDHCPIRSKPFRNDYGVLNIGLYTKSHCDCDADFYRCLREVRSRTADLLGNLYFNVMKLQCMREERMKVCREMKPIALLGIERCTKYEDSPIKTVFKFTTPPVAY